MKVKPSDLESDPFDRSGIDVFLVCFVEIKKSAGWFRKPTTVIDRFLVNRFFLVIKETPDPSLN